MPPLTLSGIPSPLSPLALGTMLYGSSIPTPDAFRLLDTFVGAGGTVLDTAHGYAGWLPNGAGRSETTIGDWLKHSGARDEVVISTKGGQPRRPDPTVRATPAHLSADLSQSLERLQLPTVDLYWFHRDNPDLPVAELMEWAWAEIDAGRIRSIGASNWTTARIREANLLAQSRARPGLVGSQIGWSLMESRPEGIADPSLVHMSTQEHAGYVELGLPVFAYQAQARGFFSPEKRGSASHLKRYDTPLNQARLRIVDEIAKRTNYTPNQIGLAWFQRESFPVIPVIGARTHAQLEDALGAAHIELDFSDWQRLTAPPGFSISA
ncbi:MAG: aldo/keto reductase [Synoicihabitans sp.]